MKTTLAGIFQTRMDRCQSEQFWATASIAAVNGFVLSKKDDLLPFLSREFLLSGLCGLSVLCLLFVIERMHCYYRYRNDLAKLMEKEGDAPEYMKRTSHMFSSNGIIWLAAFALVIFLPFIVQVLVLKAKTAQ